MKAEDYTPENQAKFDEMLNDARKAEKQEHLNTYTMIWLLEPSYPRQDIAAMLNIVEHEKGWR